MNGQGHEFEKLLLENDLLRRRITEMEEVMQRQQESLTRSSSDLNIIMDGFPGLVFYKDTENRYLRVNQVVAEAPIGMTTSK